MAQKTLEEKKRVGGPQMRGPTSKRSRLDAEELLMEVIQSGKFFSDKKICFAIFSCVVLVRVVKIIKLFV